MINICYFLSNLVQQLWYYELAAALFIIKVLNLKTSPLSTVHLCFTWNPDDLPKNQVTLSLKIGCRECSFLLSILVNRLLTWMSSLQKVAQTWNFRFFSYPELPQKMIKPAWKVFSYQVLYGILPWGINKICSILQIFSWFFVHRKFLLDNRTSPPKAWS